MRVLVAEDHESLARSIANGLREEGYAVDLTSDGTEALHLAVTNPYDCVLLDIMLPGKDGWDILQSLRRRGHNMPVVVLTARDALEDRVRGLNAGADDYLVKPFEWEELLARVRAAVRRGHGHTSAVISVADLEIDTAAKTVRRGGKPVPLSARIWASGIPCTSRGASRRADGDLGPPLRPRGRDHQQHHRRVHRVPAKQDRS